MKSVDSFPIKYGPDQLIFAQTISCANLFLLIIVNKCVDNISVLPSVVGFFSNDFIARSSFSDITTLLATLHHNNSL